MNHSLGVIHTIEWTVLHNGRVKNISETAADLPLLPPSPTVAAGLSSCAFNHTPSAVQLLAEVGNVEKVAVLWSAMLCVSSALLFALTASALLRHRAVDSLTGRLVSLASVLPVVMVLSLAAICVPRAAPVLDVVMLLYFGRNLVTLTTVTTALLGGRAARLVAVAHRSIKLQTLPVCFACVCLPRPKVTVQRLMVLETLVWQAAVVRPLSTLVLACLWLDGGETPSSSPPLLPSVSAINTVSTMTAMWALNMLGNLFRKPLGQYCSAAFVRVAQLTLLLLSFQAGVLGLLAHFDRLPCSRLLPPPQFALALHHVLLIGECFLLSVAVSVTSFFFVKPADQNQKPLGEREAAVTVNY